MKSNKSLYMKENEKTGMNNYANLSSLMKDIDIFFKITMLLTVQPFKIKVAGLVWFFCNVFPIL